MIGHVGWSGGNAVVVDGEEDVAALDISGEYSAVVQTTYSEKKFENLRQMLENRCKTLEIYNTICYTTKARQREAEELANECDAMLVIGGQSSINTLMTYDICNAHCEDTYLI